MTRQNGSNELRLTRVYDAPVSVVWDAWTDPAQVAQWWGPRGYTTTTHARDLSVGGTWRFTMHGPDGAAYPNVVTWLEVEPEARLVFDHGAAEGEPPLFRVTVTFREVDGRTSLEIVHAFPTPAIAAEMAKFIKRAGGESTWDRLAEYLDEVQTDRRPFVVHRSFDAPIERVFAMWTDPAHVSQWLPPAGTTMRFVRADIAVGRSSFFVIEGENGSLHVSVEYRTIDPPHRIVYTQSFVDEHEQLAPTPGAEHWPAVLQNTVDFVAEAPDRTRVRVTTEVVGDATAAEMAAFVEERGGMSAGWAGSFDALEGLLGV